MTKNIFTKTSSAEPFDDDEIKLEEAVQRVLQIPAVGSKKFLITIGDRTVGGLVTRDQMIGPWQVPVSDVAVTASSFTSDQGEAMAMGERTPLALIDAAASARIAVGETITNIISADIVKLSDIKLSANWMAASGYKQEDQKLYEAVVAVGEEFCPALGLTIPVGKDSLSMRTTWDDASGAKSVTSPLSLVITGFSPVSDAMKTITPLLKTDVDSELILIDLGAGMNRLGGSSLAQAYNQVGNQTPDITPQKLSAFFNVITSLKKQHKILAYHDRSDGGLLTTLAEMMFTARTGMTIDLVRLHGDALEQLFNEELGAVIQVAADQSEAILSTLRESLSEASAHRIGTLNDNEQLRIIHKSGEYIQSRAQLELWWADTSYQLQRLRDNPACADEEHGHIVNAADKGMQLSGTYALLDKKYITKPKVAIFREQGVNGQIEMAAAFERAGFTSVDVHLNDLLQGTARLDDFVGLVACGGFSYGDVLGAGEGWAKSILFHENLRQQFKTFFERPDTFSLGVCNGCQMLAALKSLIPGAENWPALTRNTSAQFEARVATVKVTESPSIFFDGMQDLYLPVPVAHGEGHMDFGDTPIDQHLVALQFVDNNHDVTEIYPYNPNGSPQGITSLTTPDGRATIIMPHPERAFASRQLSWHPDEWQADSPWLRMFQNARKWVGDIS